MQNPIFYHADIDSNIKYLFSMGNGKFTCKMCIIFLKENLPSKIFPLYYRFLSKKPFGITPKKVTHYGNVFLNGVKFYDSRFKRSWVMGFQTCPQTALMTSYKSL